MERSGFLLSRTEGRRRLYTLTPNTWKSLFLDGNERLAWVVWPRIFRALEQVWPFIANDAIDGQSDLERSSSVRRVLIGDVIERIKRGSHDFLFGDVLAHPGVKLVGFFIDRIRALFRQLSPNP